MMDVYKKHPYNIQLKKWMEACPVLEQWDALNVNDNINNLTNPLLKVRFLLS